MQPAPTYPLSGISNLSHTFVHTHKCTAWDSIHKTQNKQSQAAERFMKGQELNNVKRKKRKTGWKSFVLCRLLWRKFLNRDPDSNTYTHTTNAQTATNCPAIKKNQSCTFSFILLLSLSPSLWNFSKVSHFTIYHFSILSSQPSIF